MAHLKLGTRKSPLALWQAEHVAALLQAHEPGLTVELVKISTKGDRILDTPLAKVGGKGLFVKEIEEALLDGRIDLAVHSLKDVPAELPKGLTLRAYPKRADPRDAWVSPQYASPVELPPGARVGTASLRRQCQLLQARPDLEVIPIRGSVETRLAKIETEGLHAVVLAAAGLERLGLGHRIRRKLDVNEMLPAVGQGILGIEIREKDEETSRRVGALDDSDARAMAVCERAMLHELGGGCQVPIAGHLVRDSKGWWLRGLVARPSGADMVRADGRVPLKVPLQELEALGRKVAVDLLNRGAGPILQELGMRADVSNEA
ncbi:MAG: hydroxymethylbilane synthase [Myxococcota bacterium]